MAELVAEPLVGTLIDSLTRLVKYNVELITNAKDEAEGLKNDLLRFRAILMDTSGERNNSQSKQAMVDDIRRLVYKAEDAIDKFVVQKANQEKRKPWERFRHGADHPVKVRNIAEEIASIRQEIRTAIQQSNQFTLQALQLVNVAPPTDKKEPVVEEDDVVGFDEEAKKVIGKLIGGEKDLTAITIVGMPGQGKTTLARKVYNSQTIKYEFFPRIWVYVSQKYSGMEVFLDILSRFPGSTNNNNIFKSVEPIIQQLHKLLENRKYLIILDDVWTGGAWDELKRAFPKNNKGSRILITSRHKNVATHANPTEVGTHNLIFLPDDKSQELLEIKVFGKGKRPVDELQDLAKQIAIKCHGLPLAVVIIAGILLNDRESKSWWENVAKNFKTFIVTDQEIKFMDIVAWSYRHLPYHLRPCFLYLGAFRKGSEIVAQKLTHLWIAEGFIEESGGMSLEDTAEACVTELVNRNLLITLERKVSGQIKTCRVHDILREFCTTEARKQNLYHEIESFNQVTLADQYRRVCVHSGIETYLSNSKLSGQYVRSFLCFPNNQIFLDLQDILRIPKAFKLLRVLDIESISFENFPNDVVQLVLLSYLALSCKISFLPPKISKLWNMQTLTLRTRYPMLKLPEEVWKMNQLRHLNTDASAQLPRPPTKGEKGMENMQSLSRISPESCTEHVFARTPKIKKLGVRGKIDELFRRFFDNVGKLEYLTNLKLENDVFHGQPSQDEILGLPPADKFPKMLKKLTLSNTLLNWEHMQTLGNLENLEVLKVKAYAFQGKYWQTKDGGFISLKLLHIERTDLVTWEASKDHFPRLKCLLLRYCDKLEAVPTCLADVATFQFLELHHTNDKAKASAREIKRIKTEEEGEHTTTLTGFTLSIYPPDGSQNA